MNTAASQLSFGAPGWLWALLLLPALAALFVWAERQAARRLETLIQLPRLRAQLTAGASVGRRRWRYALGLAGLAGLVLAMAEPRVGYEVEETHRRGLDLIVIVDVSKSMLATDVTPNRLTRAKLSVQDLVGQLSGDRLGLVAFAGNAFLQAPLTVAYDAVLDAAAELDTDLIPRGGTNIGGAIDLALEAFGKAEAGNRAIVLLSDGEPTSDTEQADGIAAAGRAALAGVKVFTIGLGTTDGSLIPLDRNGQDFVRDEDGKIVRTRLDEDNLRAIAKAGNGFYTRFTNGEATMRAVVGQGLSQLKAGEIDARTTRRPIERYQWPLGAGLLMLGLAGCVGERRKARVSAVAVKNTPARRVPAVVAAVVMLAFVLPAVRAEDASPAPPTSPGGALDLYQNGHYDEAYHAFEDLAKKNPDKGSLQFNAGASAYMGKQYEEALDAFGHALASDNPDLQAKSHYNFGNTLFRRGEEQKDRDAKIKDWKNAIQHYNSTLDALKREGKDSPLASNTAYNRDLVQKRLDEEEKKTPPPQQKQDQKKQDKQQKQDQQKQNQSQKQDQPQKQDQQQKQDQPQKQDQQDQQSQGQGQPSQDQQQQQQSQQNQPPQPKDQSDQKQPSSGKPSDQKSDTDQPPKPGDGQPSERNDKPPDPSSLPKQDQPRQRGDFQSQGSPTPSPQGSPTPGDQPPEESREEEGKMNPSQARALLDSLKGEDDRVMLNGTPDDRKRQDEPVKKDW